MRLIALLLLVPLLCGMAWPSVFWLEPGGQWAFEEDYGAYPRVQLRLWIHAGGGKWLPTYHVYKKVLDHSWWSEWKGINNGQVLWLVHSQGKTHIYLPQIPWRSPALTLIKP